MKSPVSSNGSGARQPINHYETVRRRKDGTLLDISVTVSPLKNQEAKSSVLSKIARNITDRIRNERRRTAQYAGRQPAGRLHWSTAEAGPRVIDRSPHWQWVAGSIWLRDNAEERCLRHYLAPRQARLALREDDTRTILTAGHGLPAGDVVAKTSVTTTSPAILISQGQPPGRREPQRRLRVSTLWEACSWGLELFSPEIVQPDDDLLSLAEALGSHTPLIHPANWTRELKLQKEAAESANAAKDRFLATPATSCAHRYAYPDWAAEW